MKVLRYVVVAAVVLAALSALGVGYAFAQRPTPWQPGGWMGGMMNGFRGGVSGQQVPGWMNEMHQRMYQNGGWGGMMNNPNFDMSTMRAWMSQTGGMHTQVWGLLAEKLGLTPDELTAQLQSGKTLEQLGSQKGLTVKDLAAAMETAMETGLKQAVADGALTRAQADQMEKAMDGQYEWMIQNMGSMLSWMGTGSGGCYGTQAAPDSGTSF